MKRKLGSVAFCTLLLVTTAHGQTGKIDGEWFRYRSTLEDQQFVAGYLDCYANGATPNKTFPQPQSLYADRVRSYYKQHPDKLQQEVGSVLFDTRNDESLNPSKPTHDWPQTPAFNGDYWRWLTVPERDAFITGYLDCRRRHRSSRKQTWHYVASTYSDAISTWFGIAPEDPSQIVHGRRFSPAEIDPKRQNVTIAAALYKLHDSTEVKRAAEQLIAEMNNTLDKIRTEPSTNRWIAAVHLADISARVDPELVDDKLLAEMISLVSTKDDAVREYVSIALGNLGSRALPAVPKLMEILPDSDCVLGELTSAASIRGALSKIGVTPPPYDGCHKSE